MALQYIASASGVAAAEATVDCSSSLNLQAGDIVVAVISYEGSGITVTNIRDTDGSSNNLTMQTLAAVNSLRLSTGYLLAATSDSTATFRATLSDIGENVSLVVLQFRPDSGDTVTFDSGPGTATNKWGAAVATTNISTTGTDEVVVGGAVNGHSRTYSSQQIAGGAVAGGASRGGAYLGYRIFSATQTDINFTASLSDDGTWAAQILSIKSEAGSDYSYTGVGAIALSGVAPTSESNNYSYTGEGSIAFAGAAETSQGAVNTYTGKGSIDFSGVAVTSMEPIYLYTGVGAIEFAGAATTSKTGTYTRAINHLNYDPSSYSNAQVAAAATLKVYFEHASTGRDIVGDSDTDSSTGTNYDGSADCGLHLLYDSNNRYLCSRESFEEGNDYTWFNSNDGLQDNNRFNPTPATKLSMFVGMASSLSSIINVAMFKFCWIDVWPETTGYVSDGAAFAAGLINDIEAFEASNPSLIVPYWTMPLQSDASYAQREIYNDAIRTYCETNNKWLIDMADIECHDTEGVKQTDIDEREIADADYVIADGGHLSAAGRLRMAQAYWSLLVSIAKDASIYAHTGAGSIGFSGVAITSIEPTYSYTGVGSIDFSGAALTNESNNYSYIGIGAIEFSGVGSSSESNNYSYTGIGAIDFAGEAVTQLNIGNTYIGIGSIDFSGEAVTSESNNYSYTGVGAIDFAGVGSSSESNNYSYTGVGAITFSGEAITQLNIGNTYTGTGSIDFSGAALTNESNDYAYTGAGSIGLDGTATSSESNDYSYIGVGSIEFSGAASTSGGDTIYSYVGIGAIIFSGSAGQPAKGSGLWEMSFESLSPSLTFDSLEPALTFET